MKRIILFGSLAAVSLGGCLALQRNTNMVRESINPAKEFSKSVHEGRAEDFSIFDVDKPISPNARARLQDASTADRSVMQPAALHYVDGTVDGNVDGDPRFLEKGLVLQKSLAIPNPKIDAEIQGEASKQNASQRMAPPRANLPTLPPGSRAPYISGQMRPNPSLWPDEGYGSALFRDVRAFQPMDIVSIMVNEVSVGNKKAETNTEGKLTLTAAISKFFGIETSKWASNNASLDPTALVEATTDNKFNGKGETKRQGSLKARMSAVIMEVLPNELLRIEGTKIIAMNNEEEVMVLSGLVRQRDIDATNAVDSSRIANMRIDFYGRGVMGDVQSEGWLGRLFNMIWPF